jgi:cold shock CspA family protein
METNTIMKGVVLFYNCGRMYGFIRERLTGKDYFCHNDSLIDHIKKGDAVTFELVDNPRGSVASNVKLDITLISKSNETKSNK